MECWVGGAQQPFLSDHAETRLYYNGQTLSILIKICKEGRTDPVHAVGGKEGEGTYILHCTVGGGNVTV